uniref:Uncharacterized protein n=1 Tax=viral metagenome TaxID=1070528 RepID=A0A6C0EF37_9ZZZZ
MPIKEKKSRKKNIVKDEFNHQVDAVEKITENTKPPKSSLKEIERKVLKVNFPDHTFKNELYQFIYNEQIIKSIDNNDKIYIKTIKERLGRALGIHTIVKDFNTLITLYDKSNENLPRGQILDRLLQFYEILVDMGLTLIHNFLYILDNKKILDQAIPSLADAIELTSPIIYDLKKKFEDEVHREFTFTNTELDILKL